MSQPNRNPLNNIFIGIVIAFVLPLISCAIAGFVFWYTDDTVTVLKARRKKHLKVLEDSVSSDIGKARLAARHQARGIIFQNKDVLDKTLLVPIKEIDPDDPGEIIRRKKEREVINVMKTNFSTIQEKCDDFDRSLKSQVEAGRVAAERDARKRSQLSVKPY